jgi:hypothetical protein
MARRARAVTARQAARKYRSNQDEGSFEVRYAAAAGDNVCRTSFDAVGDPAVALAFRRPFSGARDLLPQRVRNLPSACRRRGSYESIEARSPADASPWLYLHPRKRLTPPHPPRTGVRSGQMKGTLSACQSSREDRE